MSNDPNDWKEGPRQTVIALIMIPIIILIVFLLKYPVYTECREHGFSKYYCIMGK